MSNLKNKHCCQLSTTRRQSTRTGRLLAQLRARVVARGQPARVGLVLRALCPFRMLVASCASPASLAICRQSLRIAVQAVQRATVWTPKMLCVSHTMGSSFSWRWAGRARRPLLGARRGVLRSVVLLHQLDVAHQRRGLAFRLRIDGGLVVSGVEVQGLGQLFVVEADGDALPFAVARAELK